MEMFAGRNVSNTEKAIEQLREGELRRCPLRRRDKDAAGVKLICGAGGFVLGIEGRDTAQIAATCRACPIPATLQDQRACLQLRPIRLQDGDVNESFYPCRWFYALNLRRQPRSLWELCYGCPYWFPRPEIELIPRYWDETDRIREEVSHPECYERQPEFLPPFERRERSGWKRLAARLLRG
jgi:hypothetical protein